MYLLEVKNNKCKVYKLNSNYPLDGKKIRTTSYTCHATSLPFHNSIIFQNLMGDRNKLIMTGKAEEEEEDAELTCLMLIS